MKTIMHNGVPCIKAKVHRLPTKEITNVLVNTYIDPEKHSQSPVLDIQGRNKVYLESKGEVKTIESRGFKFQHLYITTDEKPKLREWCYAPSLYKVFQITSNAPLPDEAKKIIATTDPELITDGVAQPSQSFIEEYCKAGGIDEVLVEVECIGEKGLLIVDFSKKKPETIHRIEPECIGYRPKLNPDNTIIIHPVEEKMIPLSEVIKMLEEVNNLSYIQGLNVGSGKEKITSQSWTLSKYIEENL